MDRTNENICHLIKLLATHTRRSASTVSRLVTGSGDTLRRLEALSEDGSPKHRITTERAFRALSNLSEMFPADLEWPRHIPRPRNSKKKEAA